MSDRLEQVDQPDADVPRPRRTPEQQLTAIRQLMHDGEWRTLEEIALYTNYPDKAASISAQLRHLRKPAWGSWVLDKRKHTSSARGVTYEYRLLVEYSPEGQRVLAEQQGRKRTSPRLTQAEVESGLLGLRELVKEIARINTLGAMRADPLLHVVVPDSVIRLGLWLRAKSRDRNQPAITFSWSGLLAPEAASAEPLAAASVEPAAVSAGRLPVGSPTESPVEPPLEQANGGERGSGLRVDPALGTAASAPAVAPEVHQPASPEAGSPTDERPERTLDEAPPEAGPDGPSPHLPTPADSSDSRT